jgi:hypothetical protein
MGTTYTASELAALAGTTPEQVAAWLAEGRLGEVPRDAARQPVYGFEHAERKRRCAQAPTREGQRDQVLAGDVTRRRGQGAGTGRQRYVARRVVYRHGAAAQRQRQHQHCGP